jgi:hypothetical protein
LTPATRAIFPLQHHDMKSLTPLYSAVAFALALAGASAVRAQFTNAGFETGNLAGWDVAPRARVSAVGPTVDYPVDPNTLTNDLAHPYWASPYAGSFQARLVAGATPLAGVESFLNLNAGWLSTPTNNRFGLADASAIAQTVWLNGGDSVLVHWNFLAVDPTEGVNDFAFFTLSGPSGSTVHLLSNETMIGLGQGTGWQTASLMVGTSGQYRVGLGVANFEDNTVSSILYADAISAVPEASTYGLWAASICLGAAVWRGRRTRSP